MVANRYLSAYFEADIVFLNAAIVNPLAGAVPASALAVKDGLIVAVGDAETIRPLIGPRTRVIDAAGGALVAGFHDAHIHLLACASASLHIDCGPSAVSSIAELQQAVRSVTQTTPAGQWLRAGDYDEFALRERRHPTRWDLDLVAPHHPVRLMHRSHHACVLNSLALDRAGVDRDFSASFQAKLELDASGEPTGLLYEMNEYLNARVIPPLAQAELQAALARVFSTLLSKGITAVQDATVNNGSREWALIAEVLESVPLAPFVTMMRGLPERAGNVDDVPLTQSTALPKMQWGPVKLVLTEAGSEFHPSVEELFDLVSTAHVCGLPVAIHAIEESAVCVASEAIASALALKPHRDHHHRIEHASVAPPALLDRMAELKIGIVTQPGFIYHSGDRYLADVPGELHDWLYPVRAAVERGILVAAGSDAPIAPYDPIRSLATAITRRSRGGALVAPAERVAAEQALFMHTLAPALLLDLQKCMGSIEPGKRADVVLLQADPIACADPEQLNEITVVMTVVNGVVAYER